MAFRAHNLALNLATTLGYSLANAGLHWASTLYTCASPRIFWLESTNDAVAFAAGVRPVRNVGGRNYMAFAGSRTNIALRNRELDNSGVWSTSVASVVANAANGPDGTATADRVDFTASGGALIQQTFANALFTDNVNVVVSAFHRAVTGTETWRTRIGTKAGSGVLDGDITATTAWKRQLRSVGMGVGANDPFAQLRNGSDAAARSVLYDLIQWEGTSSSVWFASEPIATAGSAVTRVQPVTTMAQERVHPAMWGGKWTVRLRMSALTSEIQTGEVFTVFHVAGTTHRLVVQNIAGTVYVSLVGSGGTIQRAFTTATPQQELTVTCDIAGGALTIAGATTGDGTTAGTAGPWTPGTLYCGTSPVPDNPWYGCISEPEILP